ncbi:MAG: DUF349 domain-containing protein [Gammaproteobacteria bacterium]|nr:DUF349 domain-containing protein [Gammaproteobacteria bacterium]
MNSETETIESGNRQVILDEIKALLEVSGAIDETRAKKVRKAAEKLKHTNAAADGVDNASDEDRSLDVQIDTALATLRERIRKQVERRNRDFEKACSLMEEMETALENNELHNAEQVYHKLMSIMGTIPGLSEKRWRDIEKRLNHVRPRLRKLESWRHWSTTQVRENLISQVKQLIDAGLPPEKLARRVQQARDQWHEWDKSGDHASKELWTSFDQACEQAYQPCIAHFEKLKIRRADNLKKRRAIIDDLNARFENTDWKHPDWRELDKYVKHARRDFYKIGNVDFKHRKKLARNLDESLQQFEQYLLRECERSIMVRNNLITDIEALETVSNLREALERLEVLRKQWVITVAARRKDEHKLWKRFQDACERTYRRRDAERKKKDTERNHNLKQKQALINELVAAADAADDELCANASLLARIREQWDTIGWVPRKHEKSLENQWRHAQQKYNKALKAARARSQVSELELVARLAALCNQWEQAILSGNPIDRDTAQAEWDKQYTPAGDMAEAIQHRYQKAFKAPDDNELSRNLDQKHNACLKLEVLLELESPAEFESERMAYQIERLNASMHKDLAAQDSPRELLLLALTSGAVPADAVETVNERINHCLEHYKQAKA